jgi:hypothetical protein
MSLGSHANVWNTCLSILRQNGYVLEVSGEPDDDGSRPSDVLWTAEKDGFRFAADNPIELLGLIGIRDHLQPQADTPYWWYIDGPDIADQLMLRAFPE